MEDWKKIRLSEILSPYRVEHQIQDNVSYRQVTVSKTGSIGLRGDKLGSKIGRKRQFLIDLKNHPNTLIFTRQGLAEGAIGIVPKFLDGCAVTENMPTLSVDTKTIKIDYINKLILSEYFSEKVSKLNVVGSAQKSIHERELLKIEINLPPISVQEAQCNKFKVLDNEQDQLESEIIHQQTLLKKLRQQILQEAIEGKLTAGWRTKNSPPSEGWQAQPDGVVLNEQQPNKTPRNAKNFHRLPYNPKLKQRARELRKAGNLSEVLLWNQIKRNKLKGLDFDRQKIIGNYIVDFYCPNCQAVIEIDGSSHDDKQEYDAKRDRYLKGLGLAVIHIADSDVKKNLEGVIQWLEGHSALVEGTTPSSLRDATPPKEGNAAVLLERIRVEKERLVKVGEIKKQKPLPPIRDDEKPFELPEGWEWCRLGDLTSISSGKGFKKSEYSQDGVRLFQIANVSFEKTLWKSVIHVPKKFLKEYPSLELKVGDIVMALNRPLLGKKLKVACLSVDDVPSILYQRVGRFDLFSNSQGEWLYTYLKSPEFSEWLHNQVKGVNIPFVNQTKVYTHLIPVPPLLEQQVIVSRVDKLLLLCDRLETQITQNQAHAKGLMQVVLKEAFS